MLSQTPSQQSSHTSDPEASSSPSSGSTEQLAVVTDGCALAEWKTVMNEQLESETKCLQERIIALQTAFDEDSLYIRGDFCWRKEITSFHGKVNDAVQQQMNAMAAQLQHHVELLSTSIAERLAQQQQQTKTEMNRQQTMYEGKLRRTRTSLKKEMDRFALLEKCLRKEETHQAKEMYDRLVQQLTSEHEEREEMLHKLLQELRSSHASIELANTYLSESLQHSRNEVERLKKIITKHPPTSSSPSRKASATVSQSRWGSTNNAVVGEAYVQSLKQSLSTCRESVGTLKKQIVDLTNEKETAIHRAKQAEDTTTKVKDELTKVTQLLSESHEALISNRKTMAQIEQEKKQWEDRFSELQFRTGSNQQQLEDAVRSATETKTYVTHLEKQTQRLVSLEQSKRQLEEQFRNWMDHPADLRDHTTLLKLVESFFHGNEGNLAERNGEYENGVQGIECPEQSALELKLRYEYEKRYTNQLNIRISHERKRVLARIEMLCQKERVKALENDASSPSRSSTCQRQQGSVKNASFQRIYRIVSEAFDDLGYPDWSATDIDYLHSRIASLEALTAKQNHQCHEMEQRAEVQRMALAKADLLQQEKECLLAELTARYRELLTTYNTWKQGNDGPASNELPPQPVPLIVYGHTSSLEEKKKLRPRPVSAAPGLPSAPRRRAIEREDDRTAPQSSHRLGSMLPQSTRDNLASSSFEHRELPQQRSKPKLFFSKNSQGSSIKDQEEEHVRSILKTYLMQNQSHENQLEDSGNLGADGILQILQRRRHRK